MRSDEICGDTRRVFCPKCSALRRGRSTDGITAAAVTRQLGMDAASRCRMDPTWKSAVSPKWNRCCRVRSAWQAASCTGSVQTVHPMWVSERESSANVASVQSPHVSDSGSTALIERCSCSAQAQRDISKDRTVTSPMRDPNQWRSCIHLWRSVAWVGQCAGLALFRQRPPIYLWRSVARGPQGWQMCGHSCSGRHQHA